MFRIILFFFSICMLAPLATGADTVIRRDSAPGPGRQLYTLVLKTGTGTSATVDFAKSILKVDGMPPWVEIDNEFKSTTIEASPEQAAELATHLDVERVVPIGIATHGQGVSGGENIPKKGYYINAIEYRNRTQFEATSLSLKALLNDEMTEFKSRWMVHLSDEDKSRAESVEGVRSVTPMKACVKGSYAVEPIDRDDQEQCKATDSTIRSLLGGRVRTVWMPNENIQKWVVHNVSFEQVSQIESINGVLATRPALKGRRGREDFKDLAHWLIEKGVRFVCIAGNIEDDSPQPAIDECPQLLQGDELPIIMVASVDPTGSLSEFPKTGPEVTIHAGDQDLNV
ncbi:hypothetical protein FAVG1_09660 [Fusarium avenaceum]|nr:hypothetical protein FAVG1_09660 [Fusarium avenaceum]